MPNKPNNFNKEFDQGLTLQELRVIIHALKMQELSTSVDPRAIDAIKSRIADLPSAEALLKMAEEPKSIKNIVKEVGEIMHIIETYPKTNMEYKDRHQSVTGLPPRYRVLNWRKNMNRADSIKTLVKLSENLDNKNQGRLSNKIITCAKKIRNNEQDDKYFIEVENELIQAGLNNEAKLMKEAINPKFDPRNWINKNRMETEQNVWKGNKAEEQRKRNNLSHPVQQDVKPPSADKDFDQEKKNAVGKLLILQRENLSVIKQIEKLSIAVTEFDNTYEVQGFDIGKLKQSIATTDSLLKELSPILAHTAEKMEGKQNEAFDFSPLQQQAPASAKAPAFTGAEGTEGATGTTATEAPESALDPSTLDSNDIEEYLAYIKTLQPKVASTIKRIRLLAAVSDAGKRYIQNLMKTNPEEFAKFVKQLEARKTELSSSKSPEPPATKAPESKPTETDVKEMKAPEIAGGTSFPVNTVPSPAASPAAEKTDEQVTADEDNKRAQRLKGLLTTLDVNSLRIKEVINNPAIGANGNEAKALRGIKDIYNFNEPDEKEQVIKALDQIGKNTPTSSESIANAEQSAPQKQPKPISLKSPIKQPEINRSKQKPSKL